MVNDLFDSQDKIVFAVSNFTTLKDHAGWQLLVQVVNANIKILEDQILNGVEEETKETIDRKRDKLKAYKEVIETPDYWIKYFKMDEPYKEETDPYYTVEDIKNSRKRGS